MSAMNSFPDWISSTVQCIASKLTDSRWRVASKINVDARQTKCGPWGNLQTKKHEALKKGLRKTNAIVQRDKTQASKTRSNL